MKFVLTTVLHSECNNKGICHACNWTAFELGGKNSFGHYADWYYGYGLSLSRHYDSSV